MESLISQIMCLIKYSNSLERNSFLRATLKYKVTFNYREMQVQDTCNQPSSQVHCKNHETLLQKLPKTIHAKLPKL